MGHLGAVIGSTGSIITMVEELKYCQRLLGLNHRMHTHALHQASNINQLITYGESTFT